MKHLVWPEKATPDEARLKAKLACSRCGILIGDEYKAEMNQRGVYVAPGQSVTPAGEVVGEADTANSDMASFWVSGICSFSPKKSFGFLAKKFLAAVRSGEPERLQGVINTDFGELFRVGGDAPDWSMVANRKLGYQSGEVPQGINLITAGVDVQKDRLVYVIRGWGKKYESWLIEHGELWGETERPAVWQQLSELLNTTRDGLPIFRMAIDSGYQTEQVYKFCRLNRPVAIPTKGHDNLDKPFKAVNIDVNVRGKQLQRSVQLWHFNSDIMKCWIYGRIEWPPDQPGGWWLPEDATEDYCKQVVSEQRAVNPSGKVTWVKIRRDNHYFDAEVLAYLAVRIITAGRERLLDNRLSVAPKKRVISKGIVV